MRAGTNKRPIRADNKPILNIISDAPAAAAYSLRRLNYAYTGAPIRVRDDTITESDIPFCGQDLCTGTLLSWLSRNQVASIPLGTDGNADGVSDGWTNSNTATASPYVANAEQELRMTASTLGSDYSQLRFSSSCVVGNTVTFSVVGRVSGDVKIRAQLDWLNGGSYLSSSSSSFSTNTSDATLTISATAPATANICRVICSVAPVAGGNTGSGFFKSATVTISNQSAYVTTAYDQSGNGNHATQTTAANQPRIVNAGVLDVDASGKPCLQTILANDTHLVVADANSLDFTTNASVSVIHTPNSLGEANAGRLLNKIWLINTIADTKLGFGVVSNNGTYTLGSQSLNTITLDSNANSTKFYSNGTLNLATTGSALTANTASLYILNYNGLDRQYDGKLSELILFSTTLTDAQRQKLERNQSKYYQIGVA